MAPASQVSVADVAVGSRRDGSSPVCRVAPVQVHMQRGSARLMAQLMICLSSCSTYQRGSQWPFGDGLPQQSATSHLVFGLT